MKKSKLPKNASILQREIDIHALLAVLIVALFTGLIGYMFGQVTAWPTPY